VIARITLFHFRYAYFLVNVTNNRGFNKSNCLVFSEFNLFVSYLTPLYAQTNDLAWFRTVSE